MNLNQTTALSTAVNSQELPGETMLPDLEALITDASEHDLLSLQAIV